MAFFDSIVQFGLILLLIFQCSLSFASTIIPWLVLANWKQLEQLMFLRLCMNLSIFHSIHRIPNPWDFFASCFRFDHVVVSIDNIPIFIVLYSLSFQWWDLANWRLIATFHGIRRVRKTPLELLRFWSYWSTVFQCYLTFVPVIPNGENLASWRFLGAFHEDF